MKLDVSRESDVAAMFRRFVGTFGRVDIVVANAGIQKDAASNMISGFRNPENQEVFCNDIEARLADS